MRVSGRLGYARYVRMPIAIAMLAIACNATPAEPTKPAPVVVAPDAPAPTDAPRTRVDREGGAYLAHAAAYADAMCTCTDGACIKATMKRYADDRYLNAQGHFTLSPADEATKRAIEDRQLACMSRAMAK